MKEFLKDTFTPTAVWRIFVLSCIVALLILFIRDSANLKELQKSNKILIDRIAVLEKQSNTDHRLIGEM